MKPKRSPSWGPKLQLKTEIKLAIVSINFMGLDLTPTNAVESRSLVRLVEVEERSEASDHPQGSLSQNWGGAKPNHAVTYMVLKATVNYRRTTIPLPR
ncbi:hypothetical protein TNCV_4306981 [Trichonephila clavipes]|nr:hypothetical protein TNCV_4306981 [Trichonephila clavipes]